MSANSHIHRSSIASENLSGKASRIEDKLAVCESPEGEALDQLCSRLAASAHAHKTIHDWPRESLRWCAEAGVYRWFMPKQSGGFGWNEADQTRGYLKLAAADLTTTFIITQYMGACRRIAGSSNPVPSHAYLPSLLSGDQFATVGISHLTTSSRHLGKPALAARADGDGYRLDGMSPWVTGAIAADLLVLAATMDDGRELLVTVPTKNRHATEGHIECAPGVELVALSASCTDRVTLTNVRVEPEWVLAGPMNDVMKSGTGAGTGGLQTSTLAAGLSRAAVQYIQHEAANRENLLTIASHLDDELSQLERDLMAAASGASCDTGEIRGRANRLVLRTTQAAMTAAKGAGYVASHPVGRWCREAMFFLVWSCPQPIANEHLCELAGIQS